MLENANLIFFSALSTTFKAPKTFLISFKMTLKITQFTLRKCRIEQKGGGIVWAKSGKIVQ